MDKYIYISIPKTGTNSIHEILRNTKYNHIPAKTIKNIIGEKTYNSGVSFCFFRNPVDLVKSWYYYHKFSPNVIRKDVKDFYPETFDEWIFKMNCKTHWENKTHVKYNPKWNIHQNPLHQFEWISDGNKIIVNEVLLFDNIDIEIERIFGIKPKQKNKSSKDEYTLSDKAENKIKEIFKRDVDFYNDLLTSKNNVIHV